MKWPKRIKHRNKVLATIYRKTSKYAFYRVVYVVDGKRMMKSFAQYSGDDGAKKWAEDKVSELAKGSKVAALTPRQADDALAALKHLQTHFEDTGKHVSLLESVSAYCAATKRLPNHTLSDVVEQFLSSLGVVKRKLLKEAVEEFTAARALLGKSKDGKRSQLAPKYVENTAAWLKEFSDTFPGYVVCDLTKEHLDLHFGKFKDISAQSRNSRRGIVRPFLKWCVRKDYLIASHRLMESDGMIFEPSDSGATDYYRPNELRAMLESSDEQIRVVIALQGLAGLRLEEVLRLDWRDVFGIPNHIEVSTAKSKTRRRRLVEVCPALEQWLAPYRTKEGKVTAQWQTEAGYTQAFVALRNKLKIPSRRNGLRHGFVTYHYAMHANENLTSALAGNSPAMVHQHYKGLATKSEAEKWFNVKPASLGNVINLKSASGE